ncbi:MAG: GAF domain-containing protein, partial [Chloroflexi bacterium]|nr:GAF domain-containing protein [Chloroflexota bacterium]
MTQPQAAARALERRLTEYVVVDLKALSTPVEPLTEALRRVNTSVRILALVDDPSAALPGERPAGPDAFLRRDCAPDELARALASLAASTRQRAAPPEDSAPDSDAVSELQERMRSLEGLLQAALLPADSFEETAILGDLRHVARIAVDADDLAVLLADADYASLTDGLGLGVPEAYLRICQEQFGAFSRDERMMYLGDEVLLRERLPDMLRSAMRVREAEAAGAWSYMRLPLIIDQRLIGFVALFSETPGRFNGAHLQLGRLFAAQVSTAVRNMRLAFRLKRAEQRQQAVAHVARLIADDLALDTVLTRIVEEAIGLVQGRLGAVMLVQPDGKLIISAAIGENKDAIGHRIESGRGQAGTVALTGQPSAMTNFEKWESANPVFASVPVEGDVLLAVPLYYRGRVLGVLQVLAPRSPLDSVQEQLDVLMILAPQAAIAIAKAQLHEIVRQDQQQLRAILDYTAAAIAVCDAKGRLLIANPEAQRLFDRIGLTVPPGTEISFLHLIKERFPEVIPALTPGSLLELNLGDAGEYLLHIAAVQRPNGSIDRYVCVGQDVSELRRVERLKTDMIHVLSHDLRNPLGLARGSLELLEEDDLPEDQRAQLSSMVVSSLERMDQLIQDVVDLEQAESLGTQSATPYDLAALVEKVVKRNQSKADTQNVTMVYTEQSRPEKNLRGHALMVGQAIDNLVSNAIKYTPSGGRVEITLAVEGEQVVVRVKDTGYGIPPEAVPHLFRQFYRVHDPR